MRRAWLGFAIAAGCGNSGATVDAFVAPVDAPPPDAPVPAVEFPLASVEGGIAYTASIAIGGTQSFALDVDTGSTTLGVAAATCATCQVTPEYTPGTAAMDVGATTAAQYGDGSSWMGELFADSVAVMGDASAVRMKFASIDMQAGFFRGNNDQGIIGLAGAMLATPGADSFIAQRKTAKLSTTFAFQFCPDAGRLWFGGFDPTFTSAAPRYAPLVPQTGFYEVALQGATIGGTPVGLTGNAIVDTGTTLMILPTSVENAMLAAIQAAPGFRATFPTGTLSETSCLDATGVTAAQIDAALPPMTVAMTDPNGMPFTLSLPPTRSYLFEVQGSYCLGVATANLPTILGDTFLRAFITEFDLPNFQIGFAPEVGCTAPAMHAEPPAAPVKPPHYYLRGKRT